MATLELKPTTIKIDVVLRQRIKKIAEARHRKPHWVMLEALEDYVEREEKREALRQEAINAWEHYETTGLHATHDIVDEWLLSLERGENSGKPTCHN